MFYIAACAATHKKMALSTFDQHMLIRTSFICPKKKNLNGKLINGANLYWRWLFRWHIINAFSGHLSDKNKYKYHSQQAAGSVYHECSRQTERFHPNRKRFQCNEWNNLHNNQAQGEAKSSNLKNPRKIENLSKLCIWNPRKWWL